VVDVVGVERNLLDTGPPFQQRRVVEVIVQELEQVPCTAGGEQPGSIVAECSFL
jgi:hypothetical protein